ncbi:MAG: PD-(D/E)XK nuclease family protein [Oscillospiraceae bacterium]
MLKLILGTAGTGKSEYIKKQIQQNAQEGKKSLLLVPEQFSKTGETEIFSSLEKSQFSLVSVFSFTSLLRDVQSETGSGIKNVLTAAGKAVIAKKSLDNVYKHLNAYQNQRQNLQFSFELSSVFDDFRRNGISGEVLYKVSQGSGNHSEKLKDIALIYSEYCAQIGDKFCDNEDVLAALGETLPLSYTDKAQIYVDSFESFSFGQYKILQRLLEKGENVTVALTADSLFDTSGGTGSLCYTKKTAARLVTLAKKSGVAVAAPILLTQQHRFKNNTLKAIDNLLLGKPLPPLDGNKDAFVTEYKNQYCEISGVCGEIVKLTKQGYSYNDIAVVCPQLERYENQIEESFSAAEIPFFIDQNRIISSSAPIMLIKSILAIMNDGVNENTILPLLKTGLTAYDKDTISFLENYLYVWQEQSLDWQQPFVLSPGGMTQQPDESEQEILNRINDLTQSVKEIFAPYAQPQTPYLARTILEWVYRIITALTSEEIVIAQLTSEEKEGQELLQRQWEAAIQCLEQLYEITAEDIFKPVELSALFALMVAGTKLGFAPETQDCVMVSTPARMKIDAVKAVFVVGVAQDVFPSLINEGKLISSADREFLKEHDLELGSGFEERFSFESLYFYKTMTTASEKLFISYAKKNLDAQELLSGEAQGIKEALELPKLELCVWDYCITTEFFVQYISETEPQLGAEILKELDIPRVQLKERLFKVMDTDIIDKMLGDNMVISPTAAETYYKCAFGYFLQRLLKIKPLRKASLTQREAGDYLHYVAQMVLSKYKADYYKTEWETVKKDVDSLVNQYAIDTYPKTVRETARFSALLENMHQNALQLLHYIHREQSASEFRPIAMEQPIGFGGGLAPLNLKIEGDKTVSVVGVCDRIDVMETDKESYIRIVDYKTGTKEFKLDDIYNGLSSQLLLYMSAVIEDGIQGVKNPKPGAVVYQPSDAAFTFDKPEQELYTPVGMAVENQKISKAFDQGQKGSFGVLKGEDKISALRGSEVVSERQFERILDYAQDMIKKMAQGVYDGEFDSLPLDLGNEKTQCEWCDFGCVCQSKDRLREKQKNDFKKEEEKEHGDKLDK